MPFALMNSSLFPVLRGVASFELTSAVLPFVGGAVRGPSSRHEQLHATLPRAIACASPVKYRPRGPRTGRSPEPLLHGQHLVALHFFDA
jgi:hypothetical protein